jgi:hypothetical protein
VQVRPHPGAFHSTGLRSQYGGTAGASYIPCMPPTASSITDYAASLIGFGGQAPALGGHPEAAAVGLQAMETGLGLGGSGLATNSVPLLPRAPSGAGSGAFLNPFQVSLPLWQLRAGSRPGAVAVQARVGRVHLPMLCPSGDVSCAA